MQGASDPLLVYVFLVVQFLSSQHEGLRAIVEKFHRRYVSPMNILVIAVGDEAEYLPHAAGVTSEFDHPAGVRRKQFIPCDPSIAFLLLVFIGSRGYGCEVLLNEPLLGRRGRAGFATVTDSDDFIREVEDCPEDGSNSDSTDRSSSAGWIFTPTAISASIWSRSASIREKSN